MAAVLYKQAVIMPGMHLEKPWRCETTANKEWLLEETPTLTVFIIVKGKPEPLVAIIETAKRWMQRGTEAAA